MAHPSIQLVHADVSGQDDNLGDSALRRAYLEALAGPNRRFHLVGRVQSSDYRTGFVLSGDDIWYATREQWLASQDFRVPPVHVFNAGEIDLTGQAVYPTPRRSKELAAVQSAGGVLIAAGIGVKDARTARNVDFSESLRAADVVSWRDDGSQQAAGFGEVNPDWAFALGSTTAEWSPVESREFIAVTMRFDRPYPSSDWMAAVRELARTTSTRIVTTAQVGRDAPRAVRLAVDLGAEYCGASSFAHDVLNDHVRALYRRSLAAISDRAHGLIIGATEGALPIGSGSEPQKIRRLLDTVQLGTLVGHQDSLREYVEQVPVHIDGLAPAIDDARNRLSQLTTRIQAIVGSLAS